MGAPADKTDPFTAERIEKDVIAILDLYRAYLEQAVIVMREKNITEIKARFWASFIGNHEKIGKFCKQVRDVVEMEAGVGPITIGESDGNRTEVTKSDKPLRKRGEKSS